MKQFKKWAGPAFYYGADPLNRPILDAKRKTWRAALKWIKKAIIVAETDPFNDGLNIADLNRLIEKELEGGD